MKPYDHTKIEPKWQKEWDKKKAFAASDTSKKPKWYSLIEFPYPSGDGLHVGHIRSNTAMDIVSRKRRREGYNVLYPIGWDAFGLPTENYAIKTGIQPAAVTKKNTGIFRRQLQSLGFSFDWSREVNTTDPNYYKWTQWIFLQFLKAGLAYKKKMAINWCPKDLIGLANEEVVDGKCERCGATVEKREKEQWMLAITKYADKLLAGLDATDYVMPCLVDYVNPPRPDKPSKTRTNSHAIVYDPATKKYLIIRNKKFGWDTVVIGGVEDGEDFKDTAAREVREETGYTDLEFKRILGGPVRAEYFAKHKDENRIAITTGVYFELKSDARVAIGADEDKDNEILWIDEADFVPGKMVNSELSIWLERMKDPAKGWPKPLLDWPNFIKDSQRNWIGKSEGALIKFEIKSPGPKPNFILLHGWEGSPELNFFPWLKSELEKRGYSVQVPTLPDSKNPVVKDQVKEVLETCKFDENTVLLGHSLGGTVAMKVLEKLDKPVNTLVLAASFIENHFKDGTKFENSTHDFEYDFSLIKEKAKNVVILRDLIDSIVPDDQADKIQSKLGGQVIEATAVEGHFTAEKEPAILRALVPSIEVFTTRPDTLFGVTYVVVAPEHTLVRELLPTIKNRSEILIYLTRVKKESDLERTDASREKTGVELKGIKAINPVNGEEVPVYIADYVLADYGTGAVMAVPAHDDRDFAFAKKYNLPIKEIVMPVAGEPHAGSEFRKTVSAFVYRKSDKKFLALKWKKFNWISIPIGGIEGKKTPEAAGEREVFEETGYKARAVERLGGQTESHFFAENKNVWRARLDQPIFFEVEDENPSSVSDEEKEKHEAIWLTAEDLMKQMTHKDNCIGLERYIKNNHSYTGEGKLINSAQFNGKNNTDVMKEITAFAGGQWISKFKLRDWVFSRQRYWGEPIPVIHCEKCGIVPVPEDQLPVKLPPVKNYKPTETGESPLAAITKWVNTKCPNCKGKAKRETDTMPNWAGSSWYYLRYTDPKNAAKFADMKKLKYWTPVDWYNGGMEHVTLHLLYSRFWHKFLFDQGLVPTPEPYTKRSAHGFVLGPGGEKMSKSRGNVINPDTIVKNVGADSLRLYEMFMGPFDQAISWDENGIVGCRRFLERVWKLQEKFLLPSTKYLGEKSKNSELSTRNSVLVPLVHKTIKKVSEDIESMRFNTAVSALMILLNELESSFAKATVDKKANQKNYEIFLQLLAPFAPHITEELWSNLGNKKSIHTATWPAFDPTLLIESIAKMAIQINGKTRAEMEIAADATEDDVMSAALSLETVKKWLNGKVPIKIIVIKRRLVNIVVAA